MEIDENLQDEEIIVRCRELSDDVVAMQRRIAEAVHAGMRLTVTRGDLEYFLPLNEILFFGDGRFGCGGSHGHADL